jgi:hypothetical protein
VLLQHGNDVVPVFLQPKDGAVLFALAGTTAATTAGAVAVVGVRAVVPFAANTTTTATTTHNTTTMVSDNETGHTIQTNTDQLPTYHFFVRMMQVLRWRNPETTTRKTTTESTQHVP